MPRRRLGVALLVPGRAGLEIDGLRRACGDGALEKVQPHLTLVPPVNVREDELFDALRVLRDAAGRATALTLRVGPAVTFFPDSPTVYLEVGGDPEQLSALGDLRENVFQPPLARDLTWPFVPHVTIADEMTPARIEASVAALADYVVEVEFATVHVLEEQKHGDPHRRWLPIADCHLRPPIPVARGGLPLELVLSDGLDPESRGLIDDGNLPGMPFEMVHPPPVGDWHSLVVSARRRGELVGVAAGFTDGQQCKLVSLVVAPSHRGEGIARHLYSRFVAEGGIDIVAR